MTWRKSSRCDTGSCVEVAFDKATASLETNCVEVGFTSRCETGDCVEVARADDLVLVRDSKNPDGKPITFLPWQWSNLLERINGRDQINWDAVFFPLTFDADEIEAFAKGVDGGEFCSSEREHVWVDGACSTCGLTADPEQP